MSNQNKQIKLSRRAVLAGSGASALMAGMNPMIAFSQDLPTLMWWDIFQPLIPLHQKIWDSFAASGQAKVEYTAANPASFMQSLQLAFRSGELPDVLNIPNATPAQIVSLQEAGWFAPLSDVSFDKPFQKAVDAEGFTTFGGDLFSFPIFSPRWHFASVWYDNEVVTDGSSLGTWDGVRTAAKEATSGERYGLLLPLQFGPRMRDTLIDLAMAAGSPGTIDWATGEYAYASDHFVEALEFLLSFQKDGSLHPASSAVDARQGRARWAAGEAALFFDGPWNSGVLKGNFPDMLAKTGVSGIPTPGGNTAIINRGPITGTFWVSSQSKNPELASKLLSELTTDDYYIGLAERMDQPPLDLSAVGRANVHPTYKQIVDEFTQTVFLAPDPLLRNPAIANVYSKMRDVTPGLGEIIQGAFAGAFDDPKPILQQLSDSMSRERERAINAARDEGAEVSVDDWVFADWTRGKDYAG